MCFCVMTDSVNAQEDHEQVMKLRLSVYWKQKIKSGLRWTGKVTVLLHDSAMLEHSNKQSAHWGFITYLPST